MGALNLFASPLSASARLAHAILIIVWIMWLLVALVVIVETYRSRKRARWLDGARKRDRERESRKQNPA